MGTLSLTRISKRFGQTDAVNSVSLDIPSGEFFSIVGPSGCGKTTLLRLVAGFEAPTEGSILLDGKDITAVAPQSRGIGMVFQNYALFPHMSVAQNISFGLETRKMEKSAIAERVERILRSVGMDGKQDRPVPTLSGGEQQRVAVARALVVEPAVLLFDEPLSNLDVALRQQTREEIRSLQAATGITTIYVTHDQSEAMSLADRIAVMRSGGIEQVGTPREVYETPATPFVAQFLGAANLLEGYLDPLSRRFTAGEFIAYLPLLLGLPEGGSTVLTVRPEAVGIDAKDKMGLPGQIETMEYLGLTTHVGVRVYGILLHAVVPSIPHARLFQRGGHVGVIIDWSRCSVFAKGNS